ncbi:MAG: hypothetical protein C0621_05400 [Desulfuromonas sp.]|nr:MAG: hypothetical protein C0621_05400 [Desulfuromonas sp.]
MRRNVWRFFFGVVLGFLLSGCLAPAPRLESLPAPELLLQKIKSLNGHYRSLQGLAKVKVTTGGKTTSTRQALFLRRPDRLRSEVLSPFGTPLLLLASDGETLDLFYPGENRFYRGAASWGNLSQILRLPVSPAVLVPLVLFEPPLLPWREATVERLHDGVRLRLVADDGGEQHFDFDLELRLQQGDYIDSAGVNLSLNYGDFSPETGFPQTMALELPGASARLSLSFSEVDLNVALPLERFHLTPPAMGEVLPFPDP